MSLDNTADGQLYTFGSNRYGALGIGSDSEKKSTEPRKVSFFAERNLRVKKVCLGLFHSVALTEDGEVFTWGQGRRDMSFPFSLIFPSSLA